MNSIGIIGAGHVGANVAYSLAVQGIADEIILVDINKAKADSERQDIFDSLMFLPHKVSVLTGDYSDLGRCGIVINAAGKIDISTNNNDRSQEMRYTISAVNGFVDKVMSSGFNGTGTVLDTARLRSALSRVTGIGTESICAYMLGEHGMSQIAAWSAVSFGGRSLDDWAESDSRFRFDRVAIQAEASEDGKVIMPVSAKLCGEYGESGIFIGVPAVIGQAALKKS